MAARLGPPTAVYPAPKAASGGNTLNCPRAFGSTNLDFDATGRLVRNAPALTQAWLEQIPVGQWTVST